LGGLWVVETLSAFFASSAVKVEKLTAEDAKYAEEGSE